ncbi:MAG: ethylbenzene dehydrogenase-related protein [Deltaproteobacteria bacterium]|nr:ethylbenzene dehydrogenase-related protein [Deltaproteobacteria bacterium]
MRKLSVLSAVALFGLLLPAPGGARDINWEGVDSNSVVLFYPGVASWEFLTSDDHRLGGRDIKMTRKDCRHCHLSKEGDLDLKADDIAAGSIKMKMSHSAFEPDPIPGKPGSMLAEVKAAYDSDFLYIRVEWAAKGAGWRQVKGTGAVPDRVSMQLGATDAHFRKYGCFITCHNDLNTMPGSPAKKDVEGNPYYGRLGRDDVRLYAFYAKSSWEESKGPKELDAALKKHGRIDLRSMEFAGGKAEPFDGWIFDDRRWEEKKGLDDTGAWANGKYSSVFNIRLNSANPFDVKASEGEAVSAGFAIHEDGAKKRKHYVSFPYTIGLGASGADIEAVKLSD